MVIIGHSMWQNRYGSNPSVIGRTIRVNDIPATVIGVMPEGFKFPFNTDLWMPLAQIPNLEDAEAQLPAAAGVRPSRARRDAASRRRAS